MGYDKKGEISGTSNVCVGTIEKGRKGLKVFRKGIKLKLYLDGLHQEFVVEHEIIQGNELRRLQEADEGLKGCRR